MTLRRYLATAIAIHRMSASTKTGEYEVYLAADVDPLLARVKELEEQWHAAATVDGDLDYVAEIADLQAQLQQAQQAVKESNE